MINLFHTINTETFHYVLAFPVLNVVIFIIIMDSHIYSRNSGSGTRKRVRKIYIKKDGEMFLKVIAHWVKNVRTLNTTSRCLNHVYKHFLRNFRLSSKIRTRFMRFHIHSKHFDRKGWRIQNNNNNNNNNKIRILQFWTQCARTSRNLKFQPKSVPETKMYLEIYLFMWARFTTRAYTLGLTLIPCWQL